MDFPTRVRQLRLQSKMTQEELGKKINVTKVSISGYENGNRSPDMETLQKLSEVFDVSIDYLTGKSNYRNEKELLNKPKQEEDPDVQFIMRAREEMSPKAYARFISLAKKMKESFEEEDDEN